MNERTLGQVFTKSCVADFMVQLFSLPPSSKVLDPCFGEGAFLDSIIKHSCFKPCGYELDKVLFDRVKNRCSLNNLYNRDFLLENFTEQFDGIIMNPPYIRHEKIDGLESFGITKELLHSHKIFRLLSRKANLYMYFVLKAIELLRDEGELIAIFPECGLYSQIGEKFLSMLSERCLVEKRIEVSGDAFEKNALVSVVILKLVKKKQAALSFSLKDDNYNEIGSSINFSDSHFLPNSTPFARYAMVRRGLSTGSNSVFINPPFFPQDTKVLDEIISSPKSISGYSTDNCRLDKILMLRKNSLINPAVEHYLSMCKRGIIETKRPLTLFQKIMRGESWYELARIDCKGIIFGYMIRKDMRFILHSKAFLVRDNFYVIRPKIDSHLLLALLNNYLIYAQLEQLGKKYGAGILKLQKYDIEKLRLPNISKLSPEELSELTDCGKELAEKGAPQIVEHITFILSARSTEKAMRAKVFFERLQANRLERHR